MAAQVRCQMGTKLRQSNEQSDCQLTSHATLGAPKMASALVVLAVLAAWEPGAGVECASEQAACAWVEVASAAPGVERGVRKRVLYWTGSP